MVRSFLAIKFTSKSERRLLSLCLNNPENDPETNEWNKNAVRDLLRKLRKQPQLINELEKAISQQSSTTKCVPIAKTQDRRLFIAHRRGLPQVIYSRLWRWPDLQSHHQIRAISTCESSVESTAGVDQPNRSQTICVNPYHYERPDPKPIDSILIATSKIPPDLSTSFEDSGTTGGTKARPSDYVPLQQQQQHSAPPRRQPTVTGETIRSLLTSTPTDFATTSSDPSFPHHQQHQLPQHITLERPQQQEHYHLQQQQQQLQQQHLQQQQLHQQHLLHQQQLSTESTFGTSGVNIETSQSSSSQAQRRQYKQQYKQQQQPSYPTNPEKKMRSRSEHDPPEGSSNVPPQQPQPAVEYMSATVASTSYGPQQSPPSTSFQQQSPEHQPARHQSPQYQPSQEFQQFSPHGPQPMQLSQSQFQQAHQDYSQPQQQFYSPQQYVTPPPPAPQYHSPTSSQYHSPPQQQQQQQYHSPPLQQQYQSPQPQTQQYHSPQSQQYHSPTPQQFHTPTPVQYAGPSSQQFAPTSQIQYQPGPQQQSPPVYPQAQQQEQYSQMQDPSYGQQQQQQHYQQPIQYSQNLPRASVDHTRLPFQTTYYQQTDPGSNLNYEYVQSTEIARPFRFRQNRFAHVVQARTEGTSSTRYTPQYDPQGSYQGPYNYLTPPTTLVYQPGQQPRPQQRFQPPAPGYVQRGQFVHQAGQSGPVYEHLYSADQQKVRQQIAEEERERERLREEVRQQQIADQQLLLNYQNDAPMIVAENPFYDPPTAGPSRPRADDPMGEGIPPIDLQEVPYQEGQYWCSISYHEYDTRIGEKYHSNCRVLCVDGYTQPMCSDRFCIGGISNINRHQFTEWVRRRIGRGVRFTYVDGEVYVEGLSESSVFVSNPLRIRQEGKVLIESVSKLTQGCSAKVFSTEQFSRLLMDSVSLGFEAVYKLTNYCVIRVSFVKGWGRNYKRQSIFNTPCWVEVQLNGPLQWIDKVLRQMKPPAGCGSTS